MANLPETEDFADGTYQIETSDRVLGGPGGIANKQAEQLGNRTAWLRAAIAKIIDGTTAVGKATQLAASRTLKFKGAVSGSGSYNGSGDTEIALTLADTGVAAGTYTKVTINLKGLVTGASNPTTLAGYGITDAFTKPEATTAIQQAISSLVASSPAALDTLNELAVALGNDPNFATTMTNALAGKAGKATTLGGYGITDAFTKPETTAAIQQAVAALVASSPAALDTLKELASALGNDPNFAASMTNALAGKAAKATTLSGYGITDAFTKPETTSVIQQAIAAVVASSPAALDTLNELAAALGNDPNFATTITNALAGKAAKATTLAGYGITDAFGVGQRNVNVTASRAANTNYINTTGKTIFVAISSADANPRSIIVSGEAAAKTGSAYGGNYFLGAFVGPGESYSYAGTFFYWVEWRS